MTDKKIVFNRETARGFPRESDLEYKIVPQGVSGLVYGPHLYSVPTDGSPGEQQIKRFGEWSKEWDVEVMIGEWSADSQEEMNAFVFAFRDAGFAWTYQKWASSENSNAGNLGNVIYDSNSSPPTVFLEYLANAIDAAY